MSRTWTRRRVISTPPSSGQRSSRASATAALALAFLLPSCHGSNTSENHIKPITATLDMTPFTGTPDPAIFFEKVKTTGDLVTVDVKLHNGTGSPIAFDTFNLEIVYEFNKVQIGDVFDVNPALLGTCHAGTSCDPICLNNAAASNSGDPHTLDANGKAHFILSVAALPNNGCKTASVSADTTLVTLGFIAATTIDSPGSPIRLIWQTGPGDCGFLDNLVDLGVPCEDGNATMTAAR